MSASTVFGTSTAAGKGGSGAGTLKGEQPGAGQGGSRPLHDPGERKRLLRILAFGTKVLDIPVGFAGAVAGKRVPGRPVLIAVIPVCIWNLSHEAQPGVGGPACRAGSRGRTAAGRTGCSIHWGRARPALRSQVQGKFLPQHRGGAPYRPYSPGRVHDRPSSIPACLLRAPISSSGSCSIRARASEGRWNMVRPLRGSWPGCSPLRPVLSSGDGCCADRRRSVAWLTGR